MIKNISFLFLLLHFKSFCQIISFDSIKSSYFKCYDIVFIGEQHNFNYNEIIEIKLISLIKDNDTKVCVEFQSDLNIPFSKTFTDKDTSTYSFRNYSQNGYKLKLLKFFYQENIAPKAINVFRTNYFLKDEILKIYSEREFPIEIKNDIKYFSNIGSLKFPMRHRNMKRYIFFIDEFQKKRSIHSTYLGADTNKVFEYFDALDAMLYAEDDPSKDAPLFSKFREGFMYNMLKKEINIEANSKIISINGHAHIDLDEKSNWIRNKDFVPLAKLVKDSFPNKNVCSVYLLNLEQDVYFAKDYSVEKKYIKDNVEKGKEYIINLDYENSPFRKLVGKYTHIVVY